MGKVRQEKWWEPSLPTLGVQEKKTYELNTVQRNSKQGIRPKGSTTELEDGNHEGGIDPASNRNE